MNMAERVARECCGSNNYSSANISSNRSPANRFLDWAVKIISVAIVAFAAYTSFQLFLPFFILGIGFGAYDINENDPIMRSIDQISGCLSNGAPVNLPKAIAVAGAMGMHAAHIDHHPIITVPIWGIIGGMLTAASIHWCYKNVKPVQVQQPAQC